MACAEAARLSIAAGGASRQTVAAAVASSSVAGANDSHGITGSRSS
jgi:hypothetical protein